MLKSAIQGRIHLPEGESPIMSKRILDTIRGDSGRHSLGAFHSFLDTLAHRHGEIGQSVATHYRSMAPQIHEAGAHSEMANAALREVVRQKAKATKIPDPFMRRIEMARGMNPEALTHGENYRDVVKHPKALAFGKTLRKYLPGKKTLGVGLGLAALGGAGYLGYKHMKKKREAEESDQSESKSASFQKIASLAFGMSPPDRTRVRSGALR